MVCKSLLMDFILGLLFRSKLTAEGHDFLEAIRNKEVWSTLKTGFKDASIRTLVTVSKELFNRALAKQLDKHFE